VQTLHVVLGDDDLPAGQMFLSRRMENGKRFVSATL
jgi:hypothetical protein